MSFESDWFVEMSPPVYEAKVQMKDAHGNWIDKLGNQGVNTMFPSSWTSERIKVEIDGAWKVQRNGLTQMASGTGRAQVVCG